MQQIGVQLAHQTVTRIIADVFALALQLPFLQGHHVYIAIAEERWATCAASRGDFETLRVNRRERGTGKALRERGTGKALRERGTGKVLRERGTGKARRERGDGKARRERGTSKARRERGTGKALRERGTGKARREWGA